jgi:hypothetical protein
MEKVHNAHKTSGGHSRAHNGITEELSRDQLGTRKRREHATWLNLLERQRVDGLIPSHRSLNRSLMLREGWRVEYYHVKSVWDLPKIAETIGDLSVVRSAGEVCHNILSTKIDSRLRGIHRNNGLCPTGNRVN